MKKQIFLLCLIVLSPAIWFAGGYKTGFVHQENAVEIIKAQRKNIERLVFANDIYKKALKACGEGYRRCLSDLSDSSTDE